MEGEMEVSVMELYKARTTRGKSLWFILLILFGYIAGISSKLVSAEYMANFEDKWYVLVFYILNFILVFIDTMIYFRNKKLDKLAEDK